MKKMKQLPALLLAAAMLAGCASAAETQEVPAEENVQSLTAQDDSYTGTELYVEYNDGSCEVLTYASNDLLQAARELLEQEEDVALVQPNYSYGGDGVSVNDTLSGSQWALENDGSFTMEESANDYAVYEDPFGSPAGPGQWKNPWMKWSSRRGTTTVTSTAGVDINAEAGWSAYNGGTRDVIIALIDTGVDTSHEDLQGAFWVNEDEIAGNGIDDDGNGYIDDVNGWNFYSNSNRIYTSANEDDHGTHCAGSILANTSNGTGIAGIARGSHIKIMVIKALGGTDGSGSTSSVVQAIRYAEANGASICNLSLGSSYNDRALYNAIANSNMLFVCAAGNDGANTDNHPSYPASYALDNIISVANISCDGTLHASSDYGAQSVDLAAPGTYILSTTPKNTYSYMSGTSMAAPMVTAAAAMVYSQNSSISAIDTKSIILSTTQALPSLSGKTVTGGMLDLGAALSCNSASGLPESNWKQEKNNQGSAPEITVYTTQQHGVNYLLVEVRDADSDLSLAAYLEGECSAEEIRNTGTAFTVDRNSQAWFTYDVDGVYSFYASDSAGNETVKTVTLTVSQSGRQGGGYDSGPGGGTGFPFNGGWF